MYHILKSFAFIVLSFISQVVYCQNMPTFNPRPAYYEGVKAKVYENLKAYIEIAPQTSSPLVTNSHTWEAWDRILERMKKLEGFKGDVDFLIDNKTAKSYFISCFFELYDVADERYELKGVINSKVAFEKMQEILDGGWLPSRDIKRLTASQEKLSHFFNDSWANYIINQSGTQGPYNGDVGKLAVKEAYKIDSSFGVLMEKTRTDNFSLSSRGVQHRVLQNWADFNEAYLLDQGVYLNISFETNKEKRMLFYFPIAYQIEKREKPMLPNADGIPTEVNILYCRKMDNLNLVGHPAHSNTLNSIIMLDLNAVDKHERKISSLLSGEDSTYSLGGYTSSPDIDAWIIKTYTSLNKETIKYYNLQSTAVHELTHKSQQYNPVDYQLNDRYGLTEKEWNSYSQRRIQTEHMAYLASLCLEQDAGETVLDLICHYFNEKNTTYPIVARHILNALAGNEVDEWPAYNEQEAIISMAVSLLNDKKLSKKAQKLFEEAYPDFDLKAIEQIALK